MATEPAGMPTTKAFSKFGVMWALFAAAMICGLTMGQVSAEPMHTPTKMPMADAESVGMSTEGLSRIDEMMQKHVDAGNIQGGATIVARRGKVVHFSTHGLIDVEKGRAMETDAIYLMASSAKPVIGVASLMLFDEGLPSPSDPISKFIPEFADVKVAIQVESKSGDATEGSGKDRETGR